MKTCVCARARSCVRACVRACVCGGVRGFALVGPSVCTYTLSCICEHVCVNPSPCSLSAQVGSCSHFKPMMTLFRSVTVDAEFAFEVQHHAVISRGLK